MTTERNHYQEFSSPKYGLSYCIFDSLRDLPGTILNSPRIMNQRVTSLLLKLLPLLMFEFTSMQSIIMSLGENKQQI